MLPFPNFIINNENVKSLQNLANKYKVPFLQKQTKDKILSLMIFKISTKKKKKTVSNKIKK